MRNKRLPVTLAFLAMTCAGAQAARGAQYDHANVVIVLDASGSMHARMRSAPTRKIDAAKQALKEALKTMPENTHVGLLVFSSSNVSEDWLYPLGPRDGLRLTRAIDQPEPGGETPLGEYIKKAADALLIQRQAQYGYGSYRLLIVTDGEATDAELLEQYVPEVLARGITMDVIGVDMTAEHTLATRVHSYRKADDPASLRKAVTEVLAEVAATGRDQTDQAIFDELAPIPDEVAAAMLEALSKSGNQPIGESRPYVEDASSDESSERTLPKRQKSALIMWFVILVIGFIILAKLFGRSRKRY